MQTADNIKVNIKINSQNCILLNVEGFELDLKRFLTYILQYSVKYIITKL